MSPRSLTLAALFATGVLAAPAPQYQYYRPSNSPTSDNGREVITAPLSTDSGRPAGWVSLGNMVSSGTVLGPNSWGSSSWCPPWANFCNLPVDTVTTGGPGFPKGGLPKGGLGGWGGYYGGGQGGWQPEPEPEEEEEEDPWWGGWGDDDEDEGSTTVTTYGGVDSTLTTYKEKAKRHEPEPAWTPPKGPSRGQRGGSRSGSRGGSRGGWGGWGGFGGFGGFGGGMPVAIPCEWLDYFPGQVDTGDIESSIIITKEKRQFNFPGLAALAANCIPMDEIVAPLGSDGSYVTLGSPKGVTTVGPMVTSSSGVESTFTTYKE